MLPGGHEWLCHLVGTRVVVNHSFIAKLVGVGRGCVTFDAEGGRLTMAVRDLFVLRPERDDVRGAGGALLSSQPAPREP